MHKLFLSLGIFCFWSTTLVVAQQQPPLALTPQRMIELDRFEWISVSLSPSLPPNRMVTSAMKALEGRTTLQFRPYQEWIPYDPPSFRKYPFLHIEMCTFPPQTTLTDQLHWRDFFNAGGTLFLDYCHADVESMEEWKIWGSSIYPKTQWQAMSSASVLTHSFYLLEKRMLLNRGNTSIYLLENDGRQIMIMNQTAQLSWQAFSLARVTPFQNDPAQELQLRFYVNLIMYLLTGNYKQDQLHLPTILLRRK
ncbi:DUF4159 domain-containing protein [Deltaproteobacteria bacterium TL4]